MGHYPGLQISAGSASRHNFYRKTGLAPVTDHVNYRLCSMSGRTDRASRLGERGLTMNSTKWIISGVLATGVALAPALVASAQQTSQQTPTPGQQGNWGQAG